MLSISVLGPVEVRRDGAAVAVPGGKTSELLVRLALDAGQVVRADTLIEDLWADGAAATSRNTLQSKVAKLRRSLGDADLLVSVDGGYRLAVAPEAVDALAVLAEAADAARRLEDGDRREAAATATAALGRFAGEPLASAGDGEWIAPHRARLAAARLALLEVRFAAGLGLGELGEVIGGLEAAVADHPYQEALWELLITALYRAGRQADALAAYQRVRAELADGLGLDPGPTLQRLEQRILAHDESLGAVERAPVAGVTGGGAPTGNLPSMAAELIGRDDVLAELLELVGRSRLVELVGPGGVGKTALAVAVGRELASSTEVPAGGVWLARLESAATANDVVDALVAALDVSGEVALVERLRSAPTVVVLDNCEHVVDAVAELVERLLDAAPGLRVLATSQVPLDVDGGEVVELAPLDLDDAVELFTRRARAQRQVRRDGGASADEVLRDLCASLDGLPLAIELAAARTRTLSVEEIQRRLDDRFAVLSDPTSRRPERRRELRSTIRWSYDLLFPDDQRGLWALATFAGGAPLGAVESVLSALDVPAAAAIDVVGRLASRSLVIVDAGSRSVRYRLLDSIRAFALDALDEAGLADRARAAHAAWYAEAAATSTVGVRSARQAEHLAFARVERANVDAALAWTMAHDPAAALAIANGFGWAWVVLGDSRGAERIQAALDAVGEDASAHDRAEALLLAGWIEASTDHLDQGQAHVLEAQALAAAVADVDLQARAAYFLAYVVSHRGEWRQALELTDRSDALYAGLDRAWDQAANWLFAARAAIAARDLVRAPRAAEEVARWLALVDDPWLHARQQGMLGELARIELRFDDAVDHLARAAATSGRLGFRQTEAYQTASLGRAHCQAGDYEAGVGALALAVEKAEATGDVRMAALARVHLGRVLRAVGDVDRARTELTSAVAWHRAAGGGEQAALGECLLAALDLAGGDASAVDRLEALLDAAAAAGDAPVEVFALDALALHAARGGDRVGALARCDAADERMADAAHFITEQDRVDARAVRSSAAPSS